MHSETGQSVITVEKCKTTNPISDASEMTGLLAVCNEPSSIGLKITIILNPNWMKNMLLKPLCNLNVEKKFTFLSTFIPVFELQITKTLLGSNLSIRGFFQPPSP